jgi:uncharacterized membrane protein
MSEEDEIGALREQIAQLTQRVWHLEQLVATNPAEPRRPGMNTAEPEPARRAVNISQPVAESRELRQSQSLERRIGSQWLNRIGVVAVLVGASYFLKLAFDNGWVGPGMRVLIGCLAGVALGWWSERFRRPASLAFSYSLKAIGAGFLYLSLWAAFQLYHLILGVIAFLAMMLVTAVTAWLAMAQDAELLAGLALLGGLLTPVLCGTHENHEAALFCYLLVLSLGAFVLQRYRPWPRILFGAFVGVCLLGYGWFEDYYSADQFAETLVFFTMLFSVFAVAPLYGILVAQRDRSSLASGSVAAAESGPTSPLLLAILNSAAYFVGIWSLLGSDGTEVQARAAAYAVGLAIFYGALGVALDRRVAERPGAERLLPFTHYGLAILFLTIAIPLRLHEHWITLAWLLEGALAFWAGARVGQHRVKLFAAVVFALGALRLIILDVHAWHVQPLVFNPRFATFAVAVAALVWMIVLDRSSGRESRDPVPRDMASSGMAVAVAAVMVNVLALLAAGLEIHDAFARQFREVVWGPSYPTFNDVNKARQGLEILRGFSYSALIMIYGAGLMWMGFARRSALLRWQAILLMAATVVKVFCFDVWGLDRGWRVLSFIILGALLLAVSYAYQRDWLRLDGAH